MRGPSPLRVECLYRLGERVRPVPPAGGWARMRPWAKADYAVRAAIELAAAEAGPVKGERIADAQQIPLKFLENILADLRHAGYVQSQRGAEAATGWPSRPTPSPWPTSSGPDGPLANVRGARPESVEYTGSASHLVEVWIAVRVSLRSVLEQVTLADLVAGVLPAPVKELIADADAWVSSAGGHTPPPGPPAGRPGDLGSAVDPGAGRSAAASGVDPLAGQGVAVGAEGAWK